MNRRRLLVAAGAAGLVGLSTACAPTVQAAMIAPPDFSGPALEPDWFVTFDGAKLGLTTWSPAMDAKPWAVIIGLHGMNDYANAFHIAGPAWARQGVKTIAYDARGHGRSPNRGDWGGEALLTEDLRTICRLARAEHPDVPIAVVGESMGGATAIAAFASADPPDADRLILASPAVWGWRDLPDMYAFTLWIGAHTIPGRNVTTPRSVQMRITPSDNTEMLRAMGRDRLMLFETRIDAIYGLVQLMEAAQEGIPHLEVETAFLYGARDQIIPPRAARRAASNLPVGARTALYENGYHLLLRDLQAETVFSDILSFIGDPERPLPSGAPALASVQANR